MNTKAITISFDPKKEGACGVNINKRFMKAGATSKIRVLEQTLTWLQESYIKMTHHIIEATSPKEAVARKRGRPSLKDKTLEVQPLARKRGRPKRVVQMQAQAVGEVVKRRRGRPPRVNKFNPAAMIANMEQLAAPIMTRRVGRPRKTAALDFPALS